MSKEIKSHILLPKFILKNFADSNGSLHCYDIAKNSFYLSRPSSYNTQVGRHSEDMENFLNVEIEAPLSSALAELKKWLRGQTTTYHFYADVFMKYLWALLARSPEMVDDTNKNIMKFGTSTQQQLNDIIVGEAYNLAQNDTDFANVRMQIILNTNLREFVLPASGACTYFHVKDESTHFVIILHPRIAIDIQTQTPHTTMAIGTIDLRYVDLINQFSFLQCKKDLIASNDAILRYVTGEGAELYKKAIS